MSYLREKVGLAVARSFRCSLWQTGNRNWLDPNDGVHFYIKGICGNFGHFCAIDCTHIRINLHQFSHQKQDRRDRSAQTPERENLLNDGFTTKNIYTG